MPGSLLLTLQHGKKFSQECCPIQLLNVWQEIRNSSKMAHLKSEWLSQPPIDHGFR
jgi:hypothetical protein